MEKKFNIGDKVRLVSDAKESVPMNVKGYVYDILMVFPGNAAIEGTIRDSYGGLVRCNWNDKQNQMQEKDYYEDELIQCNI